MPENRRIGTYTVVESCRIGDIEVLMAEDPKKPNGKYAVATVPRMLLPFDTEPEFAAIGNEYLTMLRTYSDIIQKEVQKVQMARKALEVPEGLIDPSDLLTTKDANLQGKLICLRPDTLQSFYRTQAYQVVLAESGFGCNPDGGGKIYGLEVATGVKIQCRRSDVQGIFDSRNLPRWLERKLSDPSYLLDTKTDTWQHLLNMRLIFPVYADISYYDEEDGYNVPVEYPGSLCEFEEQIQRAIDNERLPEEAERGLMAHFTPEDGNKIEEEIERKVWDYYPKVESKVSGGHPELYGIIECHLKEPLTSEELKAFKISVREQLSSGWSEGFESRPVEIDEGELYIDFCSCSKDWKLEEESEFQHRLDQRGMQLK